MASTDKTTPPSLALEASSDTQLATPDYAVRALNRERLAAIEEYAGPRVLDVGCGNGAYVLHLADRFDIHGVDYRQFDSWSQRRDRFAVSDAHQLDMPDESVDTILCFETLEHLHDPQRALTEYARVCRKNVILTVPNCSLTPGMRGSNLIFNHWIDRTHINFWDLEEISELARACGLNIQKKTLINRINLGAVVMESLGANPNGMVARIGARLYRLIQRRAYPMTCLVVASKAHQ